MANGGSPPHVMIRHGNSTPHGYEASLETSLLGLGLRLHVLRALLSAMDTSPSLVVVALRRPLRGLKTDVGPSGIQRQG
ncbi:hypothetical protein AXF42_Ash017390 [Apostasia shenzhenica]|uniref:Uncharacterized protein n=1 Tax=Apostasia shenzhenica TaxID=1088818 RepID=A0A2I0BDK3_9ASPA|nr:hypothetical protein AXF42_Ash017390 [Apostasia shenzhenica]